jgi:hypothetical protein
MDDDEIIENLYGETLESTQEVRTVKTTMRTLYDHEVLDCMRRAKAEEDDPQVREFLNKRWQIAYSLKQIDHYSLEDEDVTDKFQRVISMPSIVVDVLYMRFQQLCLDEFKMIELLGESGGTQDQ